MAKLYFYYSSMNAGKSTALLQSNHNYLERGMSTVVFTPVTDNRYGIGQVTSRIGVKADAIAITEADDLFQFTKAAMKETKVHCVLVDEAQFLTKDHVYQLGEITDRMNIPVLAYGLRTDFKGELFEGSQYLLAWADNLKELKTVCHCGRKATMALRLDKDGNAVKDGVQVDIGGNDKYISVCRQHFKDSTVQTAKSKEQVLEKA